MSKEIRKKLKDIISSVIISQDDRIKFIETFAELIENINTTNGQFDQFLDNWIPEFAKFESIGYTKEDFLAIRKELINQETLDKDIAYGKSKLEEWDPNTEDASDLYLNNTVLVFAPKIDTSKVITMRGMYAGCDLIITIPQLDTSNATTMEDMFTGCKSLITIPYLNTSNVNNMAGTFAICENLITIPQLDTSAVTDISYMFSECLMLVSIPQLDTRGVVSMEDMFDSCENLITIPQLNTSNVVNMDEMFYLCKNLITIPQLNTSNVIYMRGMFMGCEKLVSIPQLDTSNVINMGNMFSGCVNLLSIPKLNANRVESMVGIFGYVGEPWSISLKNIGGFINLKVNLNISGCTAVTKESLINIMAEAADLKQLNLPPKTFTFGPTLLAKLSATEKKIATDKGWILV